MFYRNIDWLQELNFSYDMSVPNVARLEPQRGGCCTVMPYFLPSGMTELPLTTSEDYTVFHILGDYSTRLWKQQMAIIGEAHGLMSFLVHPDYVIAKRAQDVYRELLERNCPVAIRPWRLGNAAGRSGSLVEGTERDESDSDGQGWKIEGTGSGRAKIAYACLDGDRLVYESS